MFHQPSASILIQATVFLALDDYNPAGLFSTEQEGVLLKCKVDFVSLLFLILLQIPTSSSRKAQVLKAQGDYRP